MRRVTPRPMAVMVLDALIRANRPCTAIELGLATRRLYRTICINDKKRIRILEWLRVRLSLRYLEEYGLIRKLATRRHTKGRAAFLYEPTEDGLIWVKQQMQLKEMPK